MDNTYFLRNIDDVNDSLVLSFIESKGSFTTGMSVEGRIPWSALREWAIGQGYLKVIDYRNQPVPAERVAVEHGTWWTRDEAGECDCNWRNDED